MIAQPSFPSARLEWIEVSRGVAALAVTLVHLSNGMSEPQYSGVNPYGDTFKYGFYGVDFFFVLSGFIIAWTCADSIGDRATAPRYLIRRFFRIFPTYWAVLAGAIIVNIVSQRVKFPYEQESFLSQALLLSTGEYWLGPAWTLQHECIFYLLFLSAFFSAKLLWIVIAAWTVITLGFNLLFAMPELAAQSILHKIVSPYSLNFVLGVIAAMCLRQNRSGILLCVAALGMLAGYALQSFGSTHQVKFALRYLIPAFCFMVTVYGAALLSVRGVPAPRIAVWFGGLTFSLYITHILPSSYLYAALARLDLYQSLNHHVIFAAALVACLVVSVLVHKYLEQPSIAMGKRIEHLVKGQVRTRVTT